eukprot:Gregarina_sp_Pseudo_9__5543@NODE_733_length_2305_cov_6_264342_g689_i0_p1_GENE_NODE_733_length_2305_cov_6_264342_g689_i0NODE_733_length_2305_cov_6_264342_g689_i0_p1_ORF_typecomplete_len461_score117_16_NODE_733_length_2305_cov_6_264342_g689_i0451427
MSEVQMPFDFPRKMNTLECCAFRCVETGAGRLSRTSTCCTLSALSSSVSGDGDAKETAAVFALRRNSTPILAPPRVSLETPSPAGLVSGTYILYLLPAGKRGQALTAARDYLGQLLGFDESHLYPLHCTLTSFFTVTASDGATNKDAIAANLAHSLLAHFHSRFGLARAGDGDTHRHHKPHKHQDANRRTTKTSGNIGRKSAALKLHAPSDSTTTASLRRRRDGDGDTGSARRSEKSGRHSRRRRLRVSHLARRKAAGCKDDSCVSCVSASSVSESLSPNACCTQVSCSSCLFQVTHSPTRNSAATEDNDKLENVFVTNDLSVILPMRLEWTASSTSDSQQTSDHLADLCHSLQASLLPSCSVSMPRRHGTQITPKSASHVALSSSKNRFCSAASIHAAARLYDSAAAFEDNSEFWDIALCEIEAWGSLDQECSSAGDRLLMPHVFREILRINRAGVSVH